MPEETNLNYNIDLQKILKEIEDRVAKYLEEVNQEVEAAKDRKYEDFPIQPVEVQSITEEKPKRIKNKIGPLSGPIRNGRAKVVENGGKIK